MIYGVDHLICKRKPGQWQQNNSIASPYILVLAENEYKVWMQTTTPLLKEGDLKMIKAKISFKITQITKYTFSLFFLIKYKS